MFLVDLRQAIAAHWDAMDELHKFPRQNPNCRNYERRGIGNLRVGFRYGVNKDRSILVCRTSGKRFSERKGTPLFYCRLPDEKAIAIFQHLQEHREVKPTSRLVGVDKNTVVRLAYVARRHGENIVDENGISR